MSNPWICDPSPGIFEMIRGMSPEFSIPMESVFLPDGMYSSATAVNRTSLRGYGLWVQASKVTQLIFINSQKYIVP